jgi:amino acid transporter
MPAARPSRRSAEHGTLQRTAFSGPGTASAFLGTYRIPGLIIMYLVANLALIIEWAKFRRRRVAKNPLLWVVTPVIGIIVLAVYALGLGAVRPRVLTNALALLEGDDSLAKDPLPPEPVRD